MFKNQKVFREIFLDFKAKRKNGEEIIALYIEYFNHIHNYISDKPLYSSFKKFLGEKIEKNNFKLVQKVIYQLQEYQKSEQYSYFFNLFEIVIQHLFKQEKIQEFFYKKLQRNYVKFICEKFNLFSYSLSFFDLYFINEECKFYVKKIYQCYHNQRILELESQVFHTDFTKDGLNFIVHSKYPLKEGTILIPYFTNKTLRMFLDNIQEHPNENQMTIADKIVIIKEIAHGFDELHSQQFYHLNLSSAAIVLNNKKDSYIFDFANDPAHNQYQSKLPPQFYYRHPYLIHDNKILAKIENKDDKNIERNIKYDIYSFGVLVHEIVTTKSPEDRFAKLNREERYNQMKNNYKKFLFSEFTNVEEFDDKYGIKRIGEIISKCMDPKENGGYSNVSEVLNDLDEVIEKLPKITKEEIKTRISHSTKSTEYECTISDLVINYYYGNEESKTYISSLITNNKFNLTSDSTLESSQNDLISQLLHFFNFRNNADVDNKFEEESDDEDNDDKRIKLEEESDDKYNDDKQIKFEKEFDDIIKNSLINSSNQEDMKLTCNQTKLIELSIKVNTTPQKNLNTSNIKIYSSSNIETNIIPITSLKQFIEFDIDQIKRTVPIFAYFIAKEISAIHSFGLYHGELSLDSIGIYYNSSTQTFIPSIIAFYFFFKNARKNHFIFENSSIESQQQQDIIEYRNIIKAIDSKNYILNLISEIESIDLIVEKLYNFIMSINGSEIIERFKINELNLNYESLELSYLMIHNIFIRIDKKSEIYNAMNHFLLVNKNEYFDLENAINVIFDFVCLMSLCKTNQIEEITDKATKIKRMLKKIKEMNDNCFDKYLVSKKDEIGELSIMIESYKNKLFGKYFSLSRKFMKDQITPFFILYYYYKTDLFTKKMISQEIKKEAIRITDTYYSVDMMSIGFIVSLNIRNLDSDFNHKIQIKIESNDDKQKINNIFDILKSIELNPEIINDSVVFEITPRIDT